MIDHQLYPHKALADTRQAYWNFCRVSVSSLDSENTCIVISVQPEHEEHGKKVVLELLNYLLDRAAQIRLEAE